MADERRQGDMNWREHISERVATIEVDIVTLERGLRANTTITQQIADDTSWLREVLKDGAGAIRFFCRVAKWWRFTLRYVLAPIGGVILIPYLVWYWFAHDYTLPLWAMRIFDLWK